MRLFLTAALILSGAPALAQPLPPPPLALLRDPPADAAHPARMEAFVLTSHGSGMNAVMYVAAGAGPHPTLLLLHGFPGNEQNLDLAQAARRAGWNVLTFHYRGSWGSGGAFSFAHSVEDAETAIDFLHTPEAVSRFAIDPARIAVAGHSLGGLTAAKAAAYDPRALGAFLIDPGDIAAFGRQFRTDAAAMQDFLIHEVRGDMPPLSGTSEQAIMDETMRARPEIDLAATLPALAGRPLALTYATRGIAGQRDGEVAAAKAAGARALDVATFDTDHSFSDKRLALARRLLDWLSQFDLIVR